MPKVSADHLAARRHQIVHAALGLFCQQGFQATTMQQIVAASGLSAGAVYHYFPTKSGLAAAAGEELKTRYVEPLSAVLAADPLPPPTDVITALLTHMAELHSREPDLTRLGIFIWGEALRDPELGAQVRTVQLAMRAALTELAARWQIQGQLPASADPAAVGAALYGLMPGYTMQLNLVGPLNPDDYLAGLLALTEAH